MGSVSEEIEAVQLLEVLSHLPLFLILAGLTEESANTATPRSKDGICPE